MRAGDGLSAAYGLARVGFGIFATAAPARLGRTWIGEDADRPGTGVILQAMGFRDIALGLGTAESAFRGDARPWLATCMLSDLGDVAATLIGRDRIDPCGVAMTSALAGAGAVAAAVLIAMSDGE